MGRVTGAQVYGQKMQLLGPSSWPDLHGRPTLLVPLGSTEQHGPHLPFDTDTQIAQAIAERAAADLADVVVAPALPYGASGEHAGFAGTLSLGTEVLTLALVELTRSASESFGRVVFVNGHGGNHAAMTEAIKQLIDEGHEVAAWWPSIPGGDAHAGRTETSLLLAINPGCVAVEKAEPGATEELTELMPALRAGGVIAVSPNGVLGDPAGASAAEGEELVDQLAADLRKVLA